MRHPRALSVGILRAAFFFWCSLASAQTGAPPSPPAGPPPDPLGRSTPRTSVFRFISAARQGDNETAAKFLNTRLRGKAAEALAQKLFVVLNRRLPAGLGLAKLSDRPEGVDTYLTRPDHNLVGTIKTNSGEVEIIVERVDRGKEGLLWLFSTETLNAIPRLYEEIDTFAVESYLPEFLVTTLVGQIPLFAWLALLLGIPLVYLLSGLLNRLIAKALCLIPGRWLHKESAPIRLLLSVPVRLLMVAFAIRVSLALLALPLLTRQLWSSMAGVITIVGVVWLLLMFNAAGEVYLRRKDTPFQNLEASAAMIRLGRRTVDFLLIFIGFLVGLRYFGVNVTAAMAGLGVGGIAIALAAQKTLENVIGGVSVVADKVVRLGEFVNVGTQSGTVEHVGLRSTRIRTMDRSVVSIPNGQIANVNVENFSLRDKFWFHHTLGLCRETPVTVMREVLGALEDLLRKEPLAESQSVRVRFLGIGSSSLDVEVFAYILVADWSAFLEKQQDLLLGMLEIVEKAGTRLAYPSQTLHWADSGSLNGSDRAPNPLKEKTAAR